MHFVDDAHAARAQWPPHGEALGTAELGTGVIGRQCGLAAAEQTPASRRGGAGPARRRRTEERPGALVGPHQTFDVLAQFVGTAAGLLQKGAALLAGARDRGVEHRVDTWPVVAVPHVPAQASPPSRS